MARLNHRSRDRSREDRAGVIITWFKQNRTRGITEEHERRAILRIENACHHIRADDHYLSMRAAFNELGADGQRIEKSGTRGRKIEAPGARGANLVLNQTRCRRKEHVRGYGGDDDQLDLTRFDPALFEQIACSVMRPARSSEYQARPSVAR